MPTLPPALKNAPLRRLLAAQLPADFADWLDFVAIGALLAFTWDVPPFVYALFALAMAGPYLVVGPFAGALVDRLPLRAVLIGSNLGRGLATLALAFAPSWPVLLALLVLRGSVDAFFTPAKQASLQALTSEQDRASANGISQAINEGSKVIAPALGGSLLIFLSPWALFAVNAGISLVAAGLAARLAEVPRPEPEGTEKTGLLSEVRAGLRAAWGLPLVRAAIGLSGAGFFALFLYDTFFAPLLKQMQFTETDLGLVLAASGAGGLVGSVIFSFLKELKHPFRWSAAGALIGAAPVLFLGWTEITGGPMSLPLLLVLFAAMGLSGGLAIMPLYLAVQNATPPETMGRVAAIQEAVVTVSIMLAPFIGALIVSLGSYGTPMLVGGVIVLAMAGVALMVDRRVG